jgi:hypothetical protein
MMYLDDDCISGPALLGFADVFVGAAPVKRTASAARPAPKKPAASSGSALPKNTIYGPAKQPKPSEVTRKHAKTIKAAKTTAAKAVNSALKALRGAKAPPKKPAAKLLRPGMKVTALGAIVPASPNKPLTPRAKSALDKQKNAVGRAAAARKKAQDAGLRAKKAAISLANAAKNQRAASLKIRRKGPGRTAVRGIDLMDDAVIGEDVRALFDEHYAQIGAAPDPNNPGYLDDGSPDPAYWGDMTSADPLAVDPAAGLNMGDVFSGTDPLEQEPGPPLPPDAHIPDMNAVGGIPYDGSKGRPPGYIGSKSYFYQTIVNPKYAERRYGFVFGGDPHNSAWPGDNFDKWVWVHGKKGDSGSIPDFPGQEPGVSGWWDNADKINPSYADTANVMKASLAKGYGVIMGNPAFPDFTGLRCDNAGNLFWLPNEAPDWLTAPLKLAAETTAKAEREAAAAAAAAEQAAMAQVQSEAALAKAQQDAANALAESQAASDQAIAQSQLDTQAQQMELDQVKVEQQQAQVQSQQDAQVQQLMAQQAQIELEQQRAESAQQQQVQQMLLEQARREQEYIAQHPEEEFANEPTEEAAEDGGEASEESADEGDDGGFDAAEGAEW